VRASGYRPAASSISPSSSRAGSSSPGVIGCLSVTSSSSAVRRASASPPAESPSAKRIHAAAASRLIRTTRAQYGSGAASMAAAIESSAATSVRASPGRPLRAAPTARVNRASAAVTGAVPAFGTGNRAAAAQSPCSSGTRARIAVPL